MKTRYMFHMPWYLNHKKETKMSLFTSAQTETYKDVKVSPEFTEEQRGEVMKVCWKNFKMFLQMCQV